MEFRIADMINCSSWMLEGQIRIYGFVQDGIIFSVLAMEILQFCTKPSVS